MWLRWPLGLGRQEVRPFVSRLSTGTQKTPTPGDGGTADVGVEWGRAAPSADKSLR